MIPSPAAAFELVGRCGLLERRMLTFSSIFKLQVHAFTRSMAGPVDIRRQQLNIQSSHVFKLCLTFSLDI